MLIQCPVQKCGAIFDHRLDPATESHQDAVCGGCGQVLQWDLPFQACRHPAKRKRTALVPLEVEGD